MLPASTAVLYLATGFGGGGQRQVQFLDALLGGRRHDNLSADRPVPGKSV